MPCVALVRHVARFGAGRTLVRGAYHVARRSVGLRVVDCLVLDRAHLRPLGTPGAFTPRWLGPREVLDLARDPRHGLDWPWRKEALARGDECLALFDGSKLAGFSWYTAHPSPVLGSRTLRFDPRWIYTYHGLTLPQYRGRRLYGHGRALALQRFCDFGYRGLVTCIERLNYGSLRSSHALGFRRCGSLYGLGRGRRTAAWADGSCAAHGIALGPRWEAGEP